MTDEERPWKRLPPGVVEIAPGRSRFPSFVSIMVTAATAARFEALAEKSGMGMWQMLSILSERLDPVEPLKGVRKTPL